MLECLECICGYQVVVARSPFTDYSAYYLCGSSGWHYLTCHRKRDQRAYLPVLLDSLKMIVRYGLLDVDYMDFVIDIIRIDVIHENVQT